MLVTAPSVCRTSFAHALAAARRAPLRSPSALCAALIAMLCCLSGVANAFDTGAIQGSVLFNGAPVPALAMAGQGALTVQAGAGIAASVNAAGSFRFPNLQQGTYPLALIHSANPLGAGATTPVTVGGTATAYLDVTNTAGIATGVIMANGQPLPVDRIVVDGNARSYSFSTDASARFAMLLPPGNYTATPRSSRTGAIVGTFHVTIAAGATTSLGSIAFDTGAIQGYVLLNGAPVPALALSGAGALTVQAGTEIAASVDAAGAFSFPNLPAGPYQLVLMHGANLAGAQAAIPVTVGGTTNAYLDVTSTAGLATGVISANGQPLPVDRIVVDGSGATNVFSTDASARFAMLLPPGNYTATPRSSATGATIGTFPFTIVAGSTTSLGTIGFNTGAIQGAVLFNAAPVPALAMAGAGALTVQAGAGIAASVNASGAFNFPNLPAGPYYLVLMHGANALGAQATIPVTIGTTASAYLDVTSSAGLATGVIMANGQPLAVDRIVVDGNGASYEFSTDASARFAMLLPPGSYTATPHSSETGAIIGTFTFNVAAGQSNAVLAAPVGEAIAAFALSPVSPNPAAGRALVTFAVPRTARVRLTLLDVQGREMAVLADGVREPGRYRAALPSGVQHAGVYFVRLQAPGVQLARRVAIVR